MKTIGIDARFYSTNFTGIGRYNAELIAGLAEMDDKNKYVIFLNSPQYEEFVCPNERFTKVKVNAGHYSLKEQTKFCYQIYRENIDLMHFTHFNAPLMYRRPSVVTIHDLILEFYPGKKMTSGVRRLAYHTTIRSIANRSKHIFSVSDNTKKDLVEIMKIKPEHITTTYNGIASDFTAETDENLLSEVKKQYNLDRPFLLYTGVWRTHKNLIRLLQAFKKLRDEMGQDILMVFTGKPDPAYPEVLWTIKSLGLTDYVRTVGLVPEPHLKSLYTLAAAYVFPSLYEGFGLPPLEAMACNTPAVVSNNSSIPEVCGRENAVFFDPKSPSDMASKINHLLLDKNLQKELIAKGRERVKFFDWKKTCEKTLEIYNQILDKDDK